MLPLQRGGTRTPDTTIMSRALVHPALLMQMAVWSRMTSDPPPDIPEGPLAAYRRAGDFAGTAADEYYAILKVVSEYDSRYLTIKEWSVTVSLAGLGLGFIQDQRWLFLLAAISALSFWTIEALAKQHQMRYYRRMRDIEVTSGGGSPQIDWAWANATNSNSAPGVPRARTGNEMSRLVLTSFWLPWVFLPHLPGVAVGVVLFWWNPTGVMW